MYFVTIPNHSTEYFLNCCFTEINMLLFCRLLFSYFSFWTLNIYNNVNCAVQSMCVTMYFAVYVTFHVCLSF